jgi:hypothetical protein
MHPPRNVSISLQGTTLLVRDASDPFDLWQALKAFYQERRPVSYSSERKSKYPETTVSDVKQIARLFDMAVIRFVFTDGRDLYGWKTESARWEEGRAAIRRLTTDVAGSQTYIDNESFWLYYTKRLAIQLSAMRAVPSRWEMAVESLGEAFVKLPETIADAAKYAGNAAAGAADDLLDGLWDAVKRPLLVGGAVVGSALVAHAVLTRPRVSREP